MGWTRLYALIVKELLAVLRDPKGRAILIGPPIVQLLVFSYAATLEVRNVDVMILNRDSGHWGQELIERIDGSPTFRKIEIAGNQAEVRVAIDNQTAIAAVEIGPDFSRNIEAGAPADLQVVLDGRRSNASQIVAGYLSQISAALAAETPAGKRAGADIVSTVPRNWFNPNLTYQWFMAIGPDHRFLLPAAALLGGSLLIFADVLARTLVAPAELPIGIITAAVGGPFFLWILLRQRSRLAL